MAYTPTPQEILAVRYEVQDVDVALPILPDATYEYILTKNTGSNLCKFLRCCKNDSNEV